MGAYYFDFFFTLLRVFSAETRSKMIGREEDEFPRLCTAAKEQCKSSCHYGEAPEARLCCWCQYIS